MSLQQVIKPKGPNRSRAMTKFRRLQVPLFITALVVCFILALLSPYLVERVGPGELGVKYRLFFGGTLEGSVYDEGIHLKYPWDEFFVYDIRVQEARPNLVLLTNTGLQIRIVLSVRFRPSKEQLPLLHKEIGPLYESKYVVPVVTDVLRRSCREFV